MADHTARRVTAMAGGAAHRAAATDGSAVRAPGRTWGAALAGLLACGLLLGACGKKGPPAPPGPPNQVTWPRTYPTH